jgi:hypothetical protein
MKIDENTMKFRSGIHIKKKLRNIEKNNFIKISSIITDQNLNIHTVVNPASLYGNVKFCRTTTAQ